MCVYVVKKKLMCDKDRFIVNTTKFANFKGLDGHWGYFYVCHIENGQT